MIATASGKVLSPVLNIVHYKLRITTASVYLCVQILSAPLLWSISGCSSGIVIVSPSQFLFLFLFHVPTLHSCVILAVLIALLCSDSYSDISCSYLLCSLNCI